MSIKKLETIVEETYNAEFRLSCKGKIWQLYVVRSKVFFIGSFEIVVKNAVEYFKSRRIPTDKRIRKNQKSFTIKYDKPCKTN